MESLTAIERAFLAGWLAGQGITSQPTFEQFKAALLDLVEYQSLHLSGDGPLSLAS